MDPMDEMVRAAAQAAFPGLELALGREEAQRKMRAGLEAALAAWPDVLGPFPASEREWRAHCAFYKLTVGQRDRAWRESERLRGELSELHQLRVSARQGEDRLTALVIDERDALKRRVDALEKQLAAAKQAREEELQRVERQAKRQAKQLEELVPVQALRGELDRLSRERDAFASALEQVEQALDGTLETAPEDDDGESVPVVVHPAARAVLALRERWEGAHEQLRYAARENAKLEEQLAQARAQLGGMNRELTVRRQRIDALRQMLQRVCEELQPGVSEEMTDEALGRTAVELAQWAAQRIGRLTEANEHLRTLGQGDDAPGAAVEHLRGVAEREYNLANQLAEALRLTQEYVGDGALPPLKDWSWFDALNAWRATRGIDPLAEGVRDDMVVEAQLVSDEERRLDSELDWVRRALDGETLAGEDVPPTPMAVVEVVQELRQIRGCLVDPSEPPRPGRAYERVQELLAELRGLYGRAGEKIVGGGSRVQRKDMERQLALVRGKLMEADRHAEATLRALKGVG